MSGKKRFLTERDYKMIIGLRADGIRLSYIASVVYGTSSKNLRSHMKCWEKDLKSDCKANPKKFEYFLETLAKSKIKDFSQEGSFSTLENLAESLSKSLKYEYSTDVAVHNVYTKNITALKGIE